MAVEASLRRYWRTWLLLVLPVAIGFPAIVTLRLLRIFSSDYLDRAAALMAAAWFIVAWIALRRMRSWQCPSCRKPFFRDPRVHVPPFYRRRYELLAMARCERCSATLSS